MRICDIEGCKGKHKGNGYCSKHWQRFKTHGDPLGGGPARERTTDVKYRPKNLGLVESFKYFMPEDPPETGPWFWRGPRDDNGYGCFVYQGHRMFAHRVSYEMFVGEIPKGQLVRHEDDVPLNIHPSNLLTGTKVDNRMDAVKRGRHNVARGESQGHSKFTEADVRKIRFLASGGMTQQAIAEKFGTRQGVVSRIVRGESWSHVYRDKEGR